MIYFGGRLIYLVFLDVGGDFFIIIRGLWVCIYFEVVLI